jgi:heat shock protein HslJ
VGVEPGDDPHIAAPLTNAQRRTERAHGLGGIPPLLDRFVDVWPGEACGSPSSATLENTHWTLLRVLGEPVVTPADRAEAYMSFDPIGTRVTGFSGCNRFTGGYEREGENLRFKNVAMTMMACADSRNPRRNSSRS